MIQGLEALLLMEAQGVINIRADAVVLQELLECIAALLNTESHTG